MKPFAHTGKMVVPTFIKRKSEAECVFASGQPVVNTGKPRTADYLIWGLKGLFLETRCDIMRNARNLFASEVFHAMPPAIITENLDEDRAQIVKCFRNAGTVDLVLLTE